LRSDVATWSKVSLVWWARYSSNGPRGMAAH
jgi:hypothetical protein